MPFDTKSSIWADSGVPPQNSAELVPPWERKVTDIKQSWTRNGEDEGKLEGSKQKGS